jgi:hypothetical protein
LAAGVISDALHQARQQGIGGKMREAGRNVGQNQVGQAAQRQKQVGDDLKEMLDILATRTAHELARLVEKLREAERDLDDLRARQEGLRKKMEEAAKNPDEEKRREELQRLSREQRKLQEEAERFARKLQRLQAEQAGRSAARAGAKMGQAGQEGEQGDAGQAGEAAAQAEKDLDEAQQQLAQRRKQAEVDLALEQLAKIEDALHSLHDRQQEVINETLRLEQIRQTEGKWTRGQALSVRNLARQEEALKDEADSLAEKLKAAQVFHLALKGACGEMQRAGELLDERETGLPTQKAEQNALRRLAQLLESLKPDKPEPGEQQQSGDQQGDPGNQQPGDGIPSLAQLKMLKLMQQDINERTLVLQEAANRQLTPDEQREYTALGEEQTALADLVLNLSKPEESPEDSPENVPDLKPEDLKLEKELLEKLLD